MKKNILLISLFVSLLYIGMLLATAPASVAAWLVQHYTHSTVSLEQAEGSLWTGHANALRFPFEGKEIVLPHFSWRTDWHRLLKGDVALNLSYGEGEQYSTGTLLIFPNKIGVEALNAFVPPILLSNSVIRIHIQQEILRITGQVNAQSVSLVFNKLAHQGEKTLDLQMLIQRIRQALSHSST